MLQGKRIAILATDGYEQSELTEPLERLRATDAEVKVVSLQKGKIRGMRGREWAEEVDVDAVVEDVSAEDFDSLVIPGGLLNPDTLRQDEAAVQLVRAMFDAKKPVAAICHGPWMLAQANVLRNRKVTSYPSIRTDLTNAGALWKDQEVVVDKGLVTSRSPADLDAFCDKVIEETREGRHEGRREAA